MADVRFATARALFESFPMASGKITVPPTDDPSLVFLRDLVSLGKMDDAISFCAYLLSRREAVWWACRSVRRLIDEIPNSEMEALEAAEAWVRDPSPELKQVAQDAATRGNQDAATTWTAYSAAWSGGAIAFGRAPPVAPPPELTPHAAAVAITLAAGRLLSPEQRTAQLKACVEDGARLAETGLS